MELTWLVELVEQQSLVTCLSSTSQHTLSPSAKQPYSPPELAASPTKTLQKCAFTTIGTGQYRLPGDFFKELEEARVETLCIGEDVARNAVKALKE